MSAAARARSRRAAGDATAIHADVCSGDGGNDVIQTGGGNDVIAGGAGNDVIDAGAGDVRPPAPLPTVQLALRCTTAKCK